MKPLVIERRSMQLAIRLCGACCPAGGAHVRSRPRAGSHRTLVARRCDNINDKNIYVGPLPVMWPNGVSAESKSCPCVTHIIQSLGYQTIPFTWPAVSLVVA